MLRLSRCRRTPVIYVDDKIRIDVIAIRGDKVDLGITAPNEVRIVRAEIISEAEAEQIDQRAKGIPVAA